MLFNFSNLSCNNFLLIILRSNCLIISFCNNIVNKYNKVVNHLIYKVVYVNLS